MVGINIKELMLVGKMKVRTEIILKIVGILRHSAH
jgi:hypothetical protein